MGNTKAIRLYLLLLVPFLTGCTCKPALKDALESSGTNRSELEAVLDHYRSADKELKKAVSCLISSLPGHYSYSGDSIQDYYRYAYNVLSDSSLTPEQQRDMLRDISDSLYSHLAGQTVPDAQVVRADFLIHSIDLAYSQWKNCPWAVQVTFQDFLDYMLPYKAVELQELDYWRDTLYNRYSKDLEHPVVNDVEYNTTMGIADYIRSTFIERTGRYGLYNRSGLPLMSAELYPIQTFGDIPDYALSGCLALRAGGIPVALDETPVGSRDVAATRWFTVLGDNGEQWWSEWDLSTTIGAGFFPYERGPKVYRNTLLINPDRLEYERKSKHPLHFDMCKADITDQYFITSDLDIRITPSQRKLIHDRYAYIASAVRVKDVLADTVITGSHAWQIVDFGKVSSKKIHFSRMGREVMYQLFVYDGDSIVEFMDPFILNKSGNIETITADSAKSEMLDYLRNNPL